MAPQNLSAHVLLITLPAEPQLSSDLAVVARWADPASDRDVIVDFSLVEFLPWVTICHLIILERVLSAAGCQLVLCSVSPDVKAIFRRAGLAKLLRFTDDELVALQSLDRSERRGQEQQLAGKTAAPLLSFDRWHDLWSPSH